MQNPKIHSVDIARLKRLYNENNSVKEFLDYVASRKNNSRQTTVDRAVYKLNDGGTRLSRRDVINVMQELDKLGYGQFKTGRRGQPSRFEWGVNMISVGKASRGEEAVITPLSLDEIRATDESDDVPAGKIRHFYQLRSDTNIALELPADLTANEAGRLASFIKTLPFEETPSA